MFKSIRTRDYRSIADSAVLPLGPITILVGRNNTGKSALLRSIYLLQIGAPQSADDIRFGCDEIVVELEASRRLPLRIGSGEYAPEVYSGGTVHVTYPRSQQLSIHCSNQGTQNTLRMEQAPQQEPNNIIYPVFSGRRTASYQQQVRKSSARTITADDNNLVSRVMDLAGSDIPEGRRFRALCNDILGVKFDVVSDENSQRIGMRIDRYNEILLESMGAGLSSALNLIVGISGATDKLFLIEEPETDLHPLAIKTLCRAILEASATNQFVISTHSSVVLASLGAASDTVIIHVGSDGQVPPTSNFAVANEPEERIEIIRDLGYELADLGLADGWLFFEESSAERLAWQWLIPWFVPRLRRIRTFAASGASRVEPIFEDYKELFLFAHLQKMYDGRAWVLVDGDEAGCSVVYRLRNKFKTWPEEHFQFLSEEDFEHYYPDVFSDAVIEALAITDKKKRKAAKEMLLKRVLLWIEEDQGRAKAAFEKSATEVIEYLRKIDAELAGLGVVSGPNAVSSAPGDAID